MSQNDPAREKERRPGLRRERMRPLPPREGRRRVRPWRFQIGRVVGKSLSMWFSNLPQFLLLTVTVFAPYIVYQYWGNVADPDVQGAPLWGIGEQILVHLLSATVSATVIYGVFQQLRGRSPGFGASITHGLSRLPAVIGVVLVIGLAYVALALPIGLASFGVGEPGASSVIVALVTIAIFVVFMVIQCGLFLAVAAAVVERPGVFGALARSWRLTSGFKWHIFVILLAIWILTALLGGVAVGVGSLMLGQEASWAIMTAITVALFSLQAVVTAVTYHDLRVAKEGVDTEQLAAIFD